RMPVDVLHGDRRQVPSLPHSRAELGHHQGVSAQFLKEVAVDGQTIGAQNVRQDLGEGAFGARHRVGAALLSHRTFGGSGLSLLGKRVFHRVLHGPLTSVRRNCATVLSVARIPIDAWRHSRISGDCWRKPARRRSTAEYVDALGTIQQPAYARNEIRWAGTFDCPAKLS